MEFDMFRERNMMDDPLVVDIILGSGVLKFGDIALCYGLNTTWKDALSERGFHVATASLCLELGGSGRASEMSMRASKGILGHPRLGRLDQFRRFLEEHALEPAGLGAERWLRMSSRQPAGSILAEGAHHMRWAWERNMTAVLHADGNDFAEGDEEEGKEGEALTSCWPQSVADQDSTCFAMCIGTAVAGNVISSISLSGSTLATSGLDPRASIFNISTGSPILSHSFELMTSEVRSVCFSPSGRLFAAGDVDGIVTVRERAACGDSVDVSEASRERPLNRRLRGHRSEVNCVSFSPDGKTLASCSDDLTILLWDVGTGEELIRVDKGHLDAIETVAFSSDGTKFASGSHDDTCKVWSVATGQCLAGGPQRAMDHAGSVWSVVFHPFFAILASGSSDMTIKIWCSDSGRRVHTLTGHTKFVVSVAFSQDGSLMASGGWDAQVILWRMAATDRPVCIRVLRGHTSYVWSVCFGDGVLVSGGHDKRVKVWDCCEIDALS